MNNLTDLLRPRICELGKIKIGGKGEKRKSRDGTKEWRLPVKYDHFVVTGLHRSPEGDLIRDEQLMAALAPYADKDGKLRQLPIALLSNDIPEVLQASFLWYSGNRVLGRSDDRKTVTWYVNPNTLEPLNEPATRPWDDKLTERDSRGNRRFRLHTVLNCMIAAKDARFGGIYKFRTTSQITADQLYGSLLQAKALTGGVLRGMPLRLVVRPLQVSPPPDFIATTVYVVHCEIVGQDLQAIQAQALDRLKAELQNAREMEDTRKQYLAILNKPADEDPNEAKAIADEFHPPPDEPVTLADQLQAGLAELARVKGVSVEYATGRLMEGARTAGWKAEGGPERFNDRWLTWSIDRVAEWIAASRPPQPPAKAPEPTPEPEPEPPTGPVPGWNGETPTTPTTAAPPAEPPPPQAAERQPGWDEDPDDDDDDEDEPEDPSPLELPEPEQEPARPAAVTPPITPPITPAVTPPITPIDHGTGARVASSTAQQQELLGMLHELGRAWSEDKTQAECSTLIGRRLPPGCPLAALTEAEATAYRTVLASQVDQKRERQTQRRKTVADHRQEVPA